MNIIERTFSVVSPADETVPGVVWSPAENPVGALILAGHPAGFDKSFPPHVARAHALVRQGFHVATIDAPGQGERPRTPEDAARVAAFQEARGVGDQPLFNQLLGEYTTSVVERAVPEWQATLDALLALLELEDDAPVGYLGITMACAIGIGLIAAEPRITAAVLGTVSAHDGLLTAASKADIPVEFLLPLDDQDLPREVGFAVFDAFASTEKVLLGFPGHHRQIPADGRLETGFFARQLKR
ncbi:alpha/beta hydrolase [Nocardia camponoti]|nr:alpha/beta hydrolase [Nocardia camponoti]